MTRRERGRPRHPGLLTPAEQRVLDELRKGGTNAEIAVRLGISPDAVKYHISNMLGKLDLPDRHVLAAWRPDRERRRWLRLAVPGVLASVGRPFLWAGVALGLGVVVVVAVLVAAGIRDEGLFASLGEAPVVQVSGGPAHACALRDSGELLCWGSNEYGQLEVPPGRYRMVSVGWMHTCAIRDSGEAVCWGDNRNARSEAPEGTFLMLSTGMWKACGVHTSGELACWPDGLPNALYGGAWRWVAVGGNHICAVRRSGEVRCWGAGPFFNQGDTWAAEWQDYGQQGLSEDGHWEVSAAASHTCVLRDSGEVACWGGDNSDGQRSVPAGSYRSISAIVLQTCAVRESGEIVCWGENRAGSTDAPLGRYQSVSGTCALRQEGGVVCWGEGPTAQVPIELQ
ncbi:MAG: hypothetical protein F4X03_13060 [Dehalococcoidia bacterium]|nr:hypothetical protein [Dehalococcoidia bacterium]MYD29819.1 hypothetical protein [Dehalococcoidia bacterium]